MLKTVVIEADSKEEAIKKIKEIYWYNLDDVYQESWYWVWVIETLRVKI